MIAATPGNVLIIDNPAAGMSFSKEHGCYCKVPGVGAATSGSVLIIALQLITELQEQRSAKSMAIIGYIHGKESVSVGVKYWVLFNRLSSCRNVV